MIQRGPEATFQTVGTNNIQDRGTTDIAEKFSRNVVRTSRSLLNHIVVARLGYRKSRPTPGVRTRTAGIV